jgi:hypothetical protein
MISRECISASCTRDDLLIVQSYFVIRKFLFSRKRFRTIVARKFVLVGNLIGGCKENVLVGVDPLIVDHEQVKGQSLEAQQILLANSADQVAKFVCFFDVICR